MDCYATRNAAAQARVAVIPLIGAVGMAQSYQELNELLSVSPGGGNSPNEKQRIRETVAHLPADVTTVLDVGCGDGRLLAELPRHYFAVGVEYSMTNLRAFRGSAPHIRGSADDLPFASASFECVICTEVLEHLPDEMFAKARTEISRVSKKYILISVPNNEDLRENRLRCVNCGFVFHRWGHVRNFCRETLESLFPASALVQSWLMGEPESYYWGPLLQLRGWLGNGGQLLDRECPSCGIVPNGKPRPLQRLVRRGIDSFQWRLMDRVLKKPYWVGALYRKVL